MIDLMRPPAVPVTPPPPPPTLVSRLLANKWLTISVGGNIVLFLLLMIAIGGNASAATPKVVATHATTHATHVVPTAIPAFHRIGETVSIGGYNVTVNSVTTSHGDEFSQPSSGDIYLIVDVTVVNTSSQAQVVSSIGDFDFKDATGQKYNDTILGSYTAPDGTLQPGDKLRGQLVYEVPTSQHTFTFLFQPDMFGTDVATWHLTD